MSYIKQEDWDSDCTPPSPPSDWTFSIGLVTTATGPTPVSSPNMIYSAASLGGIPQVATWDNEDSVGGDVIVTGTCQFAVTTNNCASSVFARSNTNPTVSGSNTYVEFRIDGDAQAFELNQCVAGTITNLFSVSVSSFVINIWYEIIGYLNGSNAGFSVQRLSDGYYLNMSTGLFQSTPTTGTYSGLTVSGQGYAGWIGGEGPTGSVYGDNWSLQTNATNVYDSDHSYATDQPFVTNSLWNLDQSSSVESFLLSSYFYISQSISVNENDSVLLFILTYDSSFSSESQSTHNVLMSYSSDSASGSETQFHIIPFFMDVDASEGNESWLAYLLSQENPLALNNQTLSLSNFYSTDQSSSFENQIRSILGGLIEDKNPATASESSLSILESSDHSYELENSFISLSIITSSITESALANSSQLPIILNSEHPSEGESYSLSRIFILIDSSIAQNAYVFSKSIFSTDSSLVREASVIFKSFILVGSLIADSAVGSEAVLPIRSSGDSPSSQEFQQTFLLPSGPSSSESAKATEVPIKIITGVNPVIATDIDFIFNSFISYSSAITEQAIGSEQQLKIGLPSDSSTSIDDQLRIVLGYQDSHAIDQYFLFNSFIDVSGAVTDLASTGEAFLSIMLAGDYGYSLDAQYYSIVPPPSVTTLTDVLSSIRSYIKSTGLFGPDNVDYVVDPDSKTLWPTTPGPICLLEPKEQSIDISNIGGGRFSKLWEWKIVIHIIVNNILDQSFKDIIITTFNGIETGIHELSHKFVKLFDQAYITNQFGQPVMIEFVYNNQFGQPRRYKDANSYNGIAIDYTFKYLQNLTLNQPYMFNNQTVVPQIQWGKLTEFYTSIAAVLNTSGLFGNGGVDFAIPSDSAYKWPVNPPVFVLIEPGPFPDSGEAVGGGRWTKVYKTEFKVHLIVDNIIDISYRDTELVSQINPIINTYNFIDQVINWLDQSWPIMPNNVVSVVELPRATRIDAPARYPGANHLSDICIYFEVKWCENMDNTIVVSATPN